MAKIRSDYDKSLFARFVNWLTAGSTQLDDNMASAMDDAAAATRKDARDLAHEQERAYEARRAAMAEREKSMYLLALGGRPLMGVQVHALFPSGKRACTCTPISGRPPRASA